MTTQYAYYGDGPRPAAAPLEPFSVQGDQEHVPILVAALGKGCRYLLTFDNRHYYPTTERIKIMPPGEFVVELRQQLLDLLSRWSPSAASNSKRTWVDFD